MFGDLKKKVQDKYNGITQKNNKETIAEGTYVVMVNITK